MDTIIAGNSGKASKRGVVEIAADGRIDGGGKIRVELPAKEYMAIRIRRAD